MPRMRVRHASLVVLVTGSALACAPDIGELEDTPSPNSVVVAQFDPTNPIPQLQLVPSPTALAQNPDGTINKDAVRPAPCELPTEAQCLEFVDGGWPTTLFPELFFSDGLVMDTLDRGIRLYEVTATGLTEVPVTISQAARPQPPEACQSGNNGSMPPMTFTSDDVTAAWGAEAVNVSIAPQSGSLKPGTQYIVVATEALRGSPLEGGAPRPVEPSALFYLLNTDDPPVTMDGTITSPLLRSQVTDSVVASLFAGRALDDLTQAELMQVRETVQQSGTSLFGLYQFVNQTVGALVQSGQLSSRDEAVIVNTWTTGAPTREATEVVFDPAGTTFPTDIRFPLPNDQLLTVPSSSVAGGLQVNFPISPDLSPTLMSVLGGLNTLNGFGLTTPIVIQTSRQVDQATLEGNVVMVELDGANMPTGNTPRVALVATASTTSAPPQIVIQPITPLQPNTRYAVGITNGVLDLSGQPVQAAQTFSLLKSPDPLIENGTVAPSVAPLLQCSTLQTTGMLAPDDVVQQTATAIEVGLARPRWQVAFQALEALSPSISRASVAMAFTYKTQSITDTVDAVKNVLLPNVYESLPPMQGRLLPTMVDVTGTSSIAALIGITDQFCLPACQSGALEPQIPRDQCAANRPAVEASPVCQLFRGAFTSNLGRARAFLMRSYDATVGNPFAGGTFTPQSIQMPDVSYIPMWVVTPQGTPPASGWPVVVFQHGLGSRKETAFLIANTFAQAGWATVAIDMPFHGQRASDIANAAGIPCTDMNGSPSVDPANVTCDIQTGTCTGGCDGMQDSSGTGFLSPNVFGVRDNFRQATIDQLTLLRTLERESMGMGPITDLDGTTVGYVGQSLGGIAGGNLAAYVTPMELEGAVLNVAGGNLIRILLETVPSISQGLFFGLAQAGVCELVDPLNPAAGCMDTPLFRTFLLLAQWVTEPGDPKGTSVGVVQQLPMRPPNFGASNILMQISQPDPVVVNGASQELALSYGFDLMSGDDSYQVYDFSMLPQATMGGGCHGFLLAPTCGQCLQDTLCNTLGAQQQAAGFVASGGMTVGSRRPATLFTGTPFEINCANPCN